MSQSNSTDITLEATVSIPGCYVSVIGVTDTGMVRDHNEDSFLIADLSARNTGVRPEVVRHRVDHYGSLFMVADGMGGGAAGEVASQMAVSHVYHQFTEGLRSILHLDKNQFAQQLRKAVEYANSAIFRESRNNPEYKGMGTTISAAALFKGILFIAQIGDSRAYLIRNGAIKQVTKDQSLVNKLLDAGLITEEEAENHENKNVILQALGVNEKVEVILSTIDLRLNDILVICSDGLSGLVKAEEICQVVLAAPAQETACSTLISMANQRGGHDNITVIVACFDGDALPQASAEDSVEYRVFAEEQNIIPATESKPVVSAETNQTDELVLPAPPKPNPFRWSLLAVVAFPIFLLLLVGGWIYFSGPAPIPTKILPSMPTTAVIQSSSTSMTIPEPKKGDSDTMGREIAKPSVSVTGEKNSPLIRNVITTPVGNRSTRLKTSVSEKKAMGTNTKGKTAPAVEAVETQVDKEPGSSAEIPVVPVEIQTDPPEWLKFLKISQKGVEFFPPLNLKPGFYKLTLLVEGTVRVLPDLEVTAGGKNLITIKVDPTDGGVIGVARRVEP